MNVKRLEEIGRKGIIDFYNDSMENIFEYIDDDVIVIGPYEGMFVRGKKKLIEGYNKMQGKPKFELSNMSSNIIELDRHNCEIFYMFMVYTHYPDGDVLQHSQRIQFTWNEKNYTNENNVKVKEARIKAFHMSNSLKMGSVDLARGSQFESPLPIEVKMSTLEQGRRIEVTGLNRTTYYFLPQTVKYIQSTDNGSHSVLYSVQGNITCIETVAALEKKYPDLLIRCHQSFLINPGFVNYLKRFELGIINGPSIPIPEKKYTKVKKQISEFDFLGGRKKPDDK